MYWFDLSPVWAELSIRHPVCQLEAPAGEQVILGKGELLHSGQVWRHHRADLLRVAGGGGMCEGRFETAQPL